MENNKKCLKTLCTLAVGSVTLTSSQIHTETIPSPSTLELTTTSTTDGGGNNGGILSCNLFVGHQENDGFVNKIPEQLQECQDSKGNTWCYWMTTWFKKPSSS